MVKRNKRLLIKAVNLFLKQYDGPDEDRRNRPEIVVARKALGLDKMSPREHYRGMNAKELKKVRTKLNMTQPELAARLRVTWRTVARWEAGSKIPETVRLALKQVQTEEGLTV